MTDKYCNIFAGRMIDVKLVTVEGKPKHSGLYICFCFGEPNRDVMIRSGVPDTHTFIGQGKIQTRLEDNLYYFDKEAAEDGLWMDTATGLTDSSITHYLDFKPVYDITKEEARKVIEDELEASYE